MLYLCCIYHLYVYVPTFQLDLEHPPEPVQVQLALKTLHLSVYTCMYMVYKV